MKIKMSPKGLAYLDDIESVVLKAYRDAVGVWTIGAGLTAASGVIKPKAGMVITRERARELTELALERNYLPRVERAFGPAAAQNVIDGAASFDWNTGAIHKASWVPAYLSGKMNSARAALCAWTKGGGKVLPGLVRRRNEEADIIFLNRYPARLVLRNLEPTAPPTHATFVIHMDATEVEKVRAAFSRIGYAPGATAGKLDRSAVTKFQKDFDLTVDGKIGKATLATLQRELDARARTKTATTATAAGGATAGVDTAISTSDSVVALVGGGVVVLGLIYMGVLAWKYRDVLAVRVQNTSPRLAAYLRSF